VGREDIAQNVPRVARYYTIDRAEYLAAESYPGCVSAAQPLVDLAERSPTAARLFAMAQTLTMRSTLAAGLVSGLSFRGASRERGAMPILWGQRVGLPISIRNGLEAGSYARIIALLSTQPN